MIQLGYAEALANEASERSVPGSVTVELARVTRELVKELRNVRMDAEHHHQYAAGLNGGDCGLCSALQEMADV